jgi:hypothetical protein
MPATKTHFEQIPVETVRKIAVEIPAQTPEKIVNPTPSSEEVVSDKMNVHGHAEVASEPERWREMALKVQQEQNPEKIVGLVQQLIATFDEEQRGRYRRPD